MINSRRRWTKERVLVTIFVAMMLMAGWVFGIEWEYGANNFFWANLIALCPVILIVGALLFDPAYYLWKWFRALPTERQVLAARR